MHSTCPSSLALACVAALCVVAVATSATPAAADEGAADDGASADTAAAATSATASAELDGWRAPEEAREVANPLTPSDKEIAFAAKMYGAACAKCHGKSGAGDGRSARFLDVAPPSFAARLPLQTDGELFWKLTNGRDPMPGFKKDLSDEQRWGLVHFLRTLVAEDEDAGDDEGDES
jgi:mono/diheme cytochrome c family protein